MLPLQAVFHGHSSRSLPPPSSPCYDEALELGFHFLISNTDTYWATIETMKLYVKEILVPYFMEQKKKLSLPDDYRCIWQIDVWAVHTSWEFREWLYSQFHWIIFLEVARASFSLVTLQMEEKENVIVVQTGLPELQWWMVRILVKAYHEVNKPNIVLKAFKKAQSGEFSLAHPSLTSLAMLDILKTLHIDNPCLFSEFSKPCSVPEAPLNRTQHADDISFNATLMHTLTGEVPEGHLLQPATNTLQPQPTLVNELDNDFPEDDADDLGEDDSKSGSKVGVSGRNSMESGELGHEGSVVSSSWGPGSAHQGGRMRKPVDLAVRNRWWEGW
ncbi:uncharacterized protein EI90DRAFT_3118343 [Cantharellus anzutake]|uniref:uncharacterized protein n=1 Tax=Cantharellus anzutake TaxID=1750568 RepID=UPI001908165D|nr:uncharacterized protein EI90DRAFT_3118343 [Cantharellus anzutake]KAF8337907.1 hypothetical protein EI90DRAFT_3118343 [Cantharellus anzutake]